MCYEDNPGVLLSKNLVGSYSDFEISHEVINLFDCENNTSDYVYLYIPPYGMLAKSKERFFSNGYKNIKHIFFLDTTEIPHVLRLKSIAYDVELYKSMKEIEEDIENLKYGEKNIRDIFPAKIGEKQKISYVTCKVCKKKYFNLERKNFLIYMNRNKSLPFKDIEGNAKKICQALYNKNFSLCCLKSTIIGERAYTFVKEKAFFDWYERDIRPCLTEDNLFNVKPVGENTLEKKYRYTGDNLLHFVGMEKQENLYTNFIYSILEENEKLRCSFFEYIVKKLKPDVPADYKPENVQIFKQYATLSKVQTEVNRLISRKSQGEKIKKNIKRLKDLGCNDDEIKKYKEQKVPFIGGYIDLYLKDSTYQLVIENKITSSINGKTIVDEKKITQIDKYRAFAERISLEEGRENNNNIITLLVPDYSMSTYDNVDASKLKYSDLSSFFFDKRNLIRKYADEFLDCLYKHSFTKEESTIIKFKKATGCIENISP